MILDQQALEKVLDCEEFSVMCNQLDQDRFSPRVKLTLSDLLAQTCDLGSDQSCIDFKKSFRSAINYGYRGKSKGQKNGITDIRKEDKRLLRDYKAMMQTHGIAQRYELSANVTPIKIVAHIPTGKRFIGCIDTEGIEYHAVIFGMSRY